MAIFVVLIPLIYQKFFIKRDYSTIFAFTQAIYVISEAINTILALGLNLKVGIPNFLLYLLGGSIPYSLEHGMTLFVSMVIVAKMVPPGIESTMYSLSLMIVGLN